MSLGNLNWIIGAIGVFCSFLFGYIGYRNGLKKESTENGKNDGVLMSDIGYIKSGVDDLKRKQEMSEARHYGLADRVSKTEESVSYAHKRIDEIKGATK